MWANCLCSLILSSSSRYIEDGADDILANIISMIATIAKMPNIVTPMIISIILEFPPCDSLCELARGCTPGGGGGAGPDDHELPPVLQNKQTKII